MKSNTSPIRCPSTLPIHLPSKSHDKILLAYTHNIIITGWFTVALEHRVALLNNLLVAVAFYLAFSIGEKWGKPGFGNIVSIESVDIFYEWIWRLRLKSPPNSMPKSNVRVLEMVFVSSESVVDMTSLSSSFN